jgi:hypothetical protein
MSMLMKSALLVLPFLPGCFVVAEDPPSAYNAPSQDETTVVESPRDEEVNYVVYREYFGCSEQEIAYFPHYRRYYALSDDDIYFIYFTSRQCGVSFDVCFHSYYYDCGRDYDRLVVYYHVPRERYFVPIGAGVAPPPMYAHVYGAYRNGTTASVTFTNQEYISLVHMKVGCEYQGHPPATYFARVQATGSSGRVIVESRDDCGRGGRTATGATVQATAPRPWKLPPQKQEQWHQERQATVARQESTFKDMHKEQVTKVESQRAQQTRTGPQDPARDQGHATPAPAPAQLPGHGQALPHKSGPESPAETNRPSGGRAPDPHAQNLGPAVPHRPGPPDPAESNRAPGGKGSDPHGQKQGQAENPPSKGPEHQPQEKPKQTEKPKGPEKPKGGDDNKGDKKDKE